MLQTDNLTAAQPQRIITAQSISSQEELLERALRPKTLDDYIGQDKAKEQLAIFIQAAKKRGEALDHTLLFGPPGLGKTTLAPIIAKELGVNLRQTSGPVLERAGDLAALLTNLEPHDVLFIDEIHRLSPVVEEILYPALEDYQLDIMIGEGPAALHPRRRDHPRRYADQPTARPLRHRCPLGVLSKSRPCHHRQPFRTITATRHGRRRRNGSRQA